MNLAKPVKKLQFNIAQFVNSFKRLSLDGRKFIPVAYQNELSKINFVKNTGLPIKDSIIRNKVIDPGSVKNIGIPPSLIIRDFELPTVCEKEMIDPTDSVIEINAKAGKTKNMFIIRRRKMKRHKRKKVKRKFRQVFLKLKRKRREKKEAVLLEEVTKIIQDGVNFDPVQYVNKNLEDLNWKAPVTRVRGRLAPKEVVEECLEKDRIKKLIQERADYCLRRNSGKL